MCLNFGTPKYNLFSIRTMENLVFLGVPILKHITVTCKMMNGLLEGAAAAAPTEAG